MMRSGQEEAPHRRTSPTGDVADRQVRLCVGMFCLLAGLRVFVFSAAFPFFGNVDEEAHFDLVCRYSHGDVPRSLGPFSAETVTLRILYGSPEFGYPHEYYALKRMPSPTWRLPGEELDQALARGMEGGESIVNYEATQPPIYYAVAGAWYNLGKLLGMRGGNLLYWARFLNVPLYVLLVWLSYVLTKRLFPASAFLQLGVALALAVFPQNIFYAINNDVLSAPLVTLSLYLLFRMYLSETASFGLAAGAGLSSAAAFLTQYTNAPVLVVLVIVGAAILGRSWRRNQMPANLASVALLVVAAGVPIGCWLARNYVVLGEPTGLVAKERFLGWNAKSVEQYWSHPIFTPAGFACFWRDLVRTFWRGELLWNGTPLAAWPIDAVYVLSSTVFLLIYVIADVAGAGEGRAESRSIAAIWLLLFALSVALLMLGSVCFDFGPCPYPSTTSPYFTSGRLILGALMPFLIMYLRGLEVLLGWLRATRPARVFLVVVLAGIPVVSEIVNTLSVFPSQFNWYISLGFPRL